MRGARSVGTWLSFAVLLATSSAINSLATISARAEVIGGRPWGCPHRYCGCASASYIGLPNKDGRWNLARNWLVFPRAAPGPGMAVVRGGHVAIIIGGQPGAWQLYDPNSGGGLSRIHVRPLFGAVVDPKGQRAAAHAEPTKSNSIRANRPARRPVYAAREFSSAGH